MGSLRLTLCTGILAAAAFTPTAHAADGGTRDGGVTVTPASPAPGADVSLRVRDCSASQGTATSDAFVSDARLTGAQGTLTGETRLRSAAEPGSYDVRVTCAGQVLTGRMTVAGTPVGDSDHSSDSASDTEPLTGESPVAPVHAGGGGTAVTTATGTGVGMGIGAGTGAAPGIEDTTHFATVATTGSGPGTLQALTGLALAGCAAAAVGVLRSRRSRGTG
ncbi:hypothetical protein OIB37_14685 [Streptomyces sp. NBC_00820]|uniref:hypothetical protein n=1 Tax=Streptomyces sp. NBC_00820 TaxID=2975842 RepID=UPI002ED241BE|nr:hypothetical protein OIB37_14685 [Streptomyces sp. NBC_00820]